MKFDPEDPRITAYVLGELAPEEAALVEKAAAADPAVRAAIDEMDGMTQLLADTLLENNAKLLQTQRNQILQAARVPGAVDVVPFPRRENSSRRPWIIVISAAAVILLGLLLFTRVPVFSPQLAGMGSTRSKAAAGDSREKEEWRVIPIEIALLPAPGPADASRGQIAKRLSGSPVAASTPNAISRAVAERDEAMAKLGDDYLPEVAERLKTVPVPDLSKLPALQPRGSVAAASAPQLPLPVQAGSASLGWVAHSVRTDHKLPPPAAVRVEEILNHFPLRPAGDAAVSQGVTLSTETLPCPWKPSASLVIIAFRGAVDGPREIHASFRADPAGVSRYRLLGYAPIDGAAESGKLPSHLPAGGLTLLAVEVEPLNGATSFGSVEWTVENKPAPAVSLTRKPDAEPSDDARFASLLCTYAQWLAGDQKEVIDGEIVAALAREVASDSLPPDRFDLLNLIDQTLNL